MIRLYFDINILTALKSSQREFKDRLIKLRNDVLIVASEVHLNDLDSSQDIELVEEDVKLLAELSQGHILHLEEGGVQYFIDDVWKLYEHHTDEGLLTANEIKDMILSHDAKEYYDKTPLTSEQKESFSYYNNLLPELVKCNTWGSAMKILIPYSFNLYFEPELFRDLLKEMRKSEANLSGKSGNWNSHEVFKQITNQYKVNFKGKSYRDVMNSVAVKSITKSKKLYNVYEQDYLNLEILGVASDKVTKKGLSMNNLIADIQHSYLASHCDVLCTNDKNMKKKLEILSNEYGFKCDVLKINELEIYLQNKVHHLEGKTFRSLVAELFCSYSLPQNSKEDFIDGHRAVTINLKFYFLVYFNVCSFCYTGDQNLSFILLTRREYSISTNTFRTEIINLIRRIEKLSGQKVIDEENMVFSTIQPILKEGLKFYDGDYTFSLKLDDNSVNPYLKIH